MLLSLATNTYTSKTRRLPKVPNVTAKIKIKQRSLKSAVPGSGWILKYAACVKSESCLGV